jgi:hypothetical protein
MPAELRRPVPCGLATGGVRLTDSDRQFADEQLPQDLALNHSNIPLPLTRVRRHANSQKSLLRGRGR